MTAAVKKKKRKRKGRKAITTTRQSYERQRCQQINEINKKKIENRTLKAIHWHRCQRYDSEAGRYVKACDEEVRFEAQASLIINRMFTNKQHKTTNRDQHVTTHERKTTTMMIWGKAAAPGPGDRLGLGGVATPREANVTLLHADSVAPPPHPALIRRSGRRRSVHVNCHWIKSVLYRLSVSSKRYSRCL